MRSTLPLFAMLIGIATLLPAQDVPPSSIRNYKFSSQIQKELTEEELRPTRAAWQYSYIGAYQKAMDLSYKVDTRHGFDQLSKADSLDFLKYKAISAKEYILTEATKTQIVILNESHLKPQHRTFARDLIQGLYNAGYRYCGLECLAPNAEATDAAPLMLDTLLQKRGYPLNSYLTGTYTTEPQMGNLVRDAISTGFTLFAYERHTKGNRELIQAQNINRILKEDPEAKIFIFCGLDHVLENPIQNSRHEKWMACQLKELTGIDPLTINQDFLTEGKKGHEAPLYRMIDQKEPTVFVKEDGEAYNGPKGFDKFDILLYQPRSVYKKNRPTWLLQNGKNAFFKLNPDVVKIDYPCLVEAFHSSDRKEAVPVDIIELQSAEDETALVLPRGYFRLNLRNPKGDTQELNIIQNN